MKGIVLTVLIFSQCAVRILADQIAKEDQAGTALQQGMERADNACYTPKIEWLAQLLNGGPHTQLCLEGCANKKALDSIVKKKSSLVRRGMVCYIRCPCDCPTTSCDTHDYLEETSCPSEMGEDEYVRCVQLNYEMGSADNEEEQPTGSVSERATKYTVSPEGLVQLSELTSLRTHAAGTTDDENQHTSSHFLPLETIETDGSLKPSPELGTMRALATTSPANEVDASLTLSEPTQDTSTKKHLEEHASVPTSTTLSQAAPTTLLPLSSSSVLPSSPSFLRSETSPDGHKASERTTPANALTSVGSLTTEETTLSASSSARKITETTTMGTAHVTSKPSLPLRFPATQKGGTTTFVADSKDSTVSTHESMTTLLSSSVVLLSEHPDTTQRFLEKMTSAPTQKLVSSRPTIGKTEGTSAPLHSTTKNFETSSAMVSVSTTRMDTHGVITLPALSSLTDVTVSDTTRRASSVRTDAFSTLLTTSKSAPESSPSSKLARLSTDKQTTLDAKTTVALSITKSTPTRSALMTDKKTTSPDATHLETSSLTESASSADKKATSSKATTSHLEVTSSSHSATTAVEDSTPPRPSTSSTPSTMNTVTDQLTLTKQTSSTAMVTSGVDGLNTEAAATTGKVSPGKSVEADTTTDQPTTEPAENCSLPCPPGYYEGPSFCYRFAPVRLSTYRKAMRYCLIGKNSDMADERDLRTMGVLTILRNVSDNESLNVDLLYVNERHSKLLLETKTVRIVSLQESSIALLKKNKTVTMDAIVNNVTAVCKVPKLLNGYFGHFNQDLKLYWFHADISGRITPIYGSADVSHEVWMLLSINQHRWCNRTEQITRSVEEFCQELACDLNDYVFYHKADLLELPQNRSLAVGQKIEVPCATRITRLTVLCMNKGYLLPHPTNILCSVSEDEIRETPWNKRVRHSCAECYAFGTERCIRVEGGVTCKCKEGWRDFTCWRTPNQCKMTGLTCEHGKCQSQIDRAVCICDEEFGGRQCTVNKTAVAWYSNTESSILSAQSVSAAALLTTNTILIAAHVVLSIVLRQNDCSDPQHFWQTVRRCTLGVAGLIVTLMRHPQILGIAEYQCRIVFVLVTSLFCHAIGILAIEAYNAYETARLRQVNNWRVDYFGRRCWNMSPGLRYGSMAVMMTTGVLIAFVIKYDVVASKWSCLGKFTKAAIDMWFPLTLYHTIAALAATGYSRNGLFARRYVPQYQQELEDHLKDALPDRKDEIEKCTEI